MDIELKEEMKRMGRIAKAFTEAEEVVASVEEAEAKLVGLQASLDEGFDTLTELQADIKKLTEDKHELIVKATAKATEIEEEAKANAKKRIDEAMAEIEAERDSMAAQKAEFENRIAEYEDSIKELSETNSLLVAEVKLNTDAVAAAKAATDKVLKGE
jgi:chromosome segregation ATPase